MAGVLPSGAVSQHTAGGPLPDGSVEVLSSGAVAPAVVTHPSSQTVTAGATATFTAAFSGSPTPTLQWQRNAAGGGTWVDISGATSASYTTPTTTVSGGSANNTDQYRCVATNASGTATTNAATLTVNASGDTTAPTWPVGAAISLVSGTVTSSGFQLDVTPATDNVAVTGYRWSTNGGSTWLADWPSPNYTFTGLAASTTYSIAVQARDAAGNYSSSLTFSQATGAASVPGFNLNSATYAIKQWETGALRTSGTVTLRVRDTSTGAHVCTISGLAINGSGLITTFATHASLALATTYEVVFDDGAGNLAVARLTTTAS